MEFENEFDVKAPLDQVWETMLDMERVAPCVPGAQVLERTGEDSYKVGIKVKVGPVSMQYEGQVEIVEKDPSAHRAVMSATAREARGQGTASAQVQMELSGDNGATHGRIATDVQLRGRAAAMGQGVIQDVSTRLVDQFAANLATMLSQAGEPEPAVAEVPTAEAAIAAPTVVREAPPPPPEPATAEGLDVLPIVSSIARERLRDPRVVGAIGAVVLLLLVLARRRR